MTDRSGDRDPRWVEWQEARLAALTATLSRLGHDLRGIFSPALLTAERLQMNQDDRIRRAGDTLVRAVERATELVARNVEYAREAPLGLDRRPLEIAALLEEAAAGCRGCEVVLPLPTLDLEVDRSLLDRAIAEVLRRAESGGARVVRLAAAADQSGATFTIEDDGPGLADGAATQLFRPRREAGEGDLGLAIARDLMRAQGGDLVLDQTGPEGSRFRLTLPPVAIRRPSPERPS